MTTTTRATAHTRPQEILEVSEVERVLLLTLRTRRKPEAPFDDPATLAAAQLDGLTSSELAAERAGWALDSLEMLRKVRVAAQLIEAKLSGMSGVPSDERPCIERFLTESEDALIWAMRDGCGPEVPLSGEMREAAREDGMTDAEMARERRAWATRLRAQIEAASTALPILRATLDAAGL